jgi:hypothetical protein
MYQLNFVYTLLFELNEIMILKKKIIFDKKTAISKTRIMSLDRFFLM